MTELLNLILLPKKFTLKIICFQIQELISQAYLFKDKRNAKPWHRILLTEACIPSPASSLDFPQELWGHFRNYTVTELKKKKKKGKSGQSQESWRETGMVVAEFLPCK